MSARPQRNNAVGFDRLVAEIREIYGTGPIELQRSTFAGGEREALTACIDSRMVSSVGGQVVQFERELAEYVDAGFGVAVVNGTSALQLALCLAGVGSDSEVITQALTFVATANAIAYLGASPVFVDVERSTLGLCPTALEAFLGQHAERRDDACFNRRTGRRIAACVPVHTLGHACRIDEIAAVCEEWGIDLIEDAAESLGSSFKGRHTGTFGRLGVFSFNGNKVITTGGGGMLVTDDAALAERALHLSTTAKVRHSGEYVHDELGYNFRMPNLNAALGCAQLAQLDGFVAARREVASRYRAVCAQTGMAFVDQPEGAESNFWMNAVVLDSREERDAFLRYTQDREILTRPIWRLMTELPMYAHCLHDGLEVSSWLEERIVTLPSSVP